MPFGFLLRRDGESFLKGSPNRKQYFLLLIKTMATNVSFIPFFVGHFWPRSYENMKLLCNLCLHFAMQDGQDGKKAERKSCN